MDVFLLSTGRTIDYVLVGMSMYAVVTAATMKRRQTTDQAIACLSFI